MDGSLVDSFDCACYRSSAVLPTSGHSRKKGIHDLKGRVLFADEFSYSEFEFGRSNWDFDINQFEIRDMPENATLNLFADCSLWQVRLRIL